MSIKLLGHVKLLMGFTPAEKTVLKELADISHDGQTVFISLEKLSLYTSYSVRSLHYTLRRLEQKSAIIPQGETRGRGYVNLYCFNVGFTPVSKNSVEQPPVESVPVKPPEELPPTNGHIPASNGHVPPRRKLDPLIDDLPPESDEEKARVNAKIAEARRLLASKARKEPTRERPGRAARARRET